MGIAVSAMAVLGLMGCASMAKPPSTDLPSRPPLVGFSYALTGSMPGSVTVDPDGTHVEVTSASSRNAWDQNYRVQATLDAASRPPLLRCQVRADESGASTEIVLGDSAPPRATARIALRNDAGAPWGQLAYDRDSARVIDPDGKARVEITRVQPGAAPVNGGFTLPAAGSPLFHVRVVDAKGVPATGAEVLQP